MIKNYFTVAYRNMLRHKGYSLINITGLAIGLAACILILLYLSYELSYDDFWENSDRIYRPVLNGILGEDEFNMAVTCAPLAQALINEFPEVEMVARVRGYGYPVLRYGDKVFSEERFFHADSNFFEIFGIRFILGDSKTALTKPNTVVITESMRRKYFGEENPIGKTLNADNRRDWEVTGVIPDFPPNSHFHFDFLASFVNYGDADNPVWVSNNFHTYIRLQPGYDYRELDEKMIDLVYRNVGPQVQQFLGVSWDQLVANGAAYRYYLQPLGDIHLHSHLDFQIEPNGNGSYITIFSIIAIFILAIACINFMNLATARSVNRAKEVGIRKTLGSGRSRLIGQFLAESILITLIASLLAIIIVLLLLPNFNNLIQLQLKISIFGNLYTVPALIAFAAVVGILAGIYPALFLSSFRPAQVLKTETQRGSGHALLRKILVVFQFVISIVLFSGSSIIYNQLSHMQNKDLGFNKENLVILEKTDDLGQSFWTFKAELLENPNILAVSNSSTIPGRAIGNSTYSQGEMSGEDARLLNVFNADVDYLRTYQIELSEGRDRQAGNPADSATVILNEAAVRVLGLTDPIGKNLVQPDDEPGRVQRYPIIGVMKDYHYQSLHRKIDPVVYFMRGNRGIGRTTTVRITADRYQETLKYIEDTWHKYAGEQAFEYVFFDEDFNRLYTTEIRTRQIVTIFSILAVIIACLGLFGLASFMMEQRTREIGIRKTLGATVPNVLVLLSRDILQLVFIAALIAFPISYFLMNKWLQNFAYRIGYSYIGFLASALIAILIALVTISHQTWKAARSNPVDALKYE